MGGSWRGVRARFPKVSECRAVCARCHTIPTPRTVHSLSVVARNGRTHTQHAAMAARTLALVALATVTVMHVATAQVTDGCSGGDSRATAANGFFTLNGVCFGVTDTVANPELQCGPACTAGGLLCEGVEREKYTATECEDILLAYANSDAAPVNMSATPPSGTRSTCSLHRGSPSEPYVLNAVARFMPANSERGCSSGTLFGGADPTSMLVCECLPDTTAPTVSGVTATQASSTSVTVSCPGPPMKPEPCTAPWKRAPHRQRPT